MLFRGSHHDERSTLGKLCVSWGTRRRNSILANRNHVQSRVGANLTVDEALSRVLGGNRFDEQFRALTDDGQLTVFDQRNDVLDRNCNVTQRKVGARTNDGREHTASAMVEGDANTRTRTAPVLVSALTRIL